MREDWKVKKIGEVCDILNGGTPDTKVKQYWGGNNLWITPKDMGRLNSIYVADTERKVTDAGLKNSSAKILPANSVILSSRAPIGHLAINLKPIATNQGCKGLVPGNNLNTLYLYYFLSNSVELLNNLGSGTTFKELSGSKLSEVEIPFPSPYEQKRIVEILNKAFAAIDKAKANAEKNLQNAKELFESYLQNVFANKGEDWEEKKISKVCELKSGATIPPSLERTEGNVIYAKVADMNLPENHIEINTSSRFVNSSEININQIIPEGSVIFPKRGGAIATNKKRKIIKPTIVDLNTMAITPGNKINGDFFYHWFSLIDLNELSNGTSIPQINNYSFNEISISYPISLKEQTFIVQKLDKLKLETKKLESIYKQKLNDLEELKKSILQKAFSGELTAGIKEYVIEQPTFSIAAEPEIIYKRASTNELSRDEQLQLYFLLFNIAYHNNKPEQAYLAEVKMEKTCHFGENTIQQLKFNRVPIKAMNGPADFERLFKLHDYAEVNGIFHYEKFTAYKKYIEDDNFMKYFGKATLAFRPFVNRVNTLLKLLLPIKTDDIDIYATTYAAWNNLLILKKEVTLIDIAKEGRWHKKKIRFTNEDFKQAIDFLKTNNLIPTGQGKLVKEKSASNHF